MYIANVIDGKDPIVLPGPANIVTVLLSIVSMRVMINCKPSPGMTGNVNVTLFVEASTT